MGKLDDAGRAIAGLLTYNPGPGIYSRLERAVEAMPENVRVQELPGLLKRYKDGVPGWELKAVDLDSTIAGRDVVPRDELLAAVRERSPVYTHGEVLLNDATGSTANDIVRAYERIPSPQPIGKGQFSGLPKYQSYGQGGDDYTEILLTQPGAGLTSDFGNHWSNVAPDAVAHARFDTHGDALRINELQSDLGIHNRKIREIENGPNVTARYGDQVYATDEMGVERPVDPQLPFPLEDAWADILIKRLALEAARKGHRAIEVASPRAIADKVGGNIDNYEHFYGKVVPGAIERLGRKMGGMIDATKEGVDPKILSLAEAEHELWRGMQARTAAERLYVQALRERIPGIDIPRPGNSEAYIGRISRPLNDVANPPVGGQRHYAEALRDSIAQLHAKQTGRDLSEGVQFANSLMPQMMRHADELRAGAAWDNTTGNLYRTLDQRAWTERPPRRYIMSDEMRKRILTQGIGASLLAPLLAPAGDE